MAGARVRRDVNKELRRLPTLLVFDVTGTSWVRVQEDVGGQSDG